MQHFGRHSLRPLIILLSTILSLYGLSGVAAADTPRLAANQRLYPREVVPLGRATEHVRKSEAPDFWALMPYLTQQQTGSSCSLAATTLLLNGLRSGIERRGDEPLMTEQSVVARTGDRKWAEATAPGGGGVSLREYESILQRALAAHGFRDAEIERTHPVVGDPASLAKFEQHLIENEKNPDNFMIINFDLGAIIDDGSIGHFALIGAYDAKNRRVLILDTVKTWFEPYWAPIERVHRAFIRNRGYVRVTVPR